jgi:hypothetical protein
MNKADQLHHQTLTSCSLYTYIRAVLKLINKLNTDAVLGVAVDITNMSTVPNADVVDFPLDKLTITLPLPTTQSNLPHEIVLYRTGTQEQNLHIKMNGRMRNRYFTEKSIQYPFRCLLLAARLFPQKILGTQVLQRQARPCVAMVIIKCRTN